MSVKQASRLISFGLAAYLSMMAAYALAQSPLRMDEAGDAAKISPEEVRKPPTLDDLFKRLTEAKDEDEAKGAARLIERRLSRSDSPTADLLMRRAMTAIRHDDYPLAIELLDRLVVLEPKWAEAWNRRAMVFAEINDDPTAVLADLYQNVTLEPRDYRAWRLLGSIFSNNEDDLRALAALRKALAIHPFLEGVREVVEKLTRRVDGTAL